MFVESGLRDLVAHLERRQASLWHACQITDLAAYLALGGVPARSLVERRRLLQTAFVTDAVDRRNGVWDKVFCNLDDFGRSFAAGWRAVPNPYGPIVLQIRPEAILSAADVAIALRSAGAHDFDRQGESLSTIEEVDRIYRYPVETGFPLSADTRFGDELRHVFRGAPIEAKSAEMSISVPGDLLPLSYVSMLRVEPFDLQGVSLQRLVAGLLREFRADLPVRVRPMGQRAEVWDDLVRFLADGPIPITWLANRADAAPSTRGWMLAIIERGLGWQFDRFASYLYTGTLEPILSMSTARRSQAAPFETADIASDSYHSREILPTKGSRRE